MANFTQNSPEGWNTFPAANSPRPSSTWRGPNNYLTAYNGVPMHQYNVYPYHASRMPDASLAPPQAQSQLTRVPTNGLPMNPEQYRFFQPSNAFRVSTVPRQQPYQGMQRPETHQAVYHGQWPHPQFLRLQQPYQEVQTPGVHQSMLLTRPQPTPNGPARPLYIQSPPIPAREQQQRPVQSRGQTQETIDLTLDDEDVAASASPSPSQVSSGDSEVSTQSRASSKTHPRSRCSRQMPDWYEFKGGLSLRTATHPEMLPQNLIKNGKHKELKKHEESDRRVGREKLMAQIRSTEKKQKRQHKDKEAENPSRRARNSKKQPSEGNRKRKEIEQKFGQRDSTLAAKKRKASKDNGQAEFLEPLTCEKIQGTSLESSSASVVPTAPNPQPIPAVIPAVIPADAPAVVPMVVRASTRPPTSKRQRAQVAMYTEEEGSDVLPRAGQSTETLPPPSKAAIRCCSAGFPRTWKPRAILFGLVASESRRKRLSLLNAQSNEHKEILRDEAYWGVDCRTGVLFPPEPTVEGPALEDEGPSLDLEETLLAELDCVEDAGEQGLDDLFEDDDDDAAAAAAE